MFIAHLPAGYLISKYWVSKFNENKDNGKLLLAIGLFSSILPDLDLIYFYWIDNQLHSHHTYWSQIPVFWLGLFLVLLLISTVTQKQIIKHIIVIAASCIILHLILDTVVGDILWLYPFNNIPYALFHINPKYRWWVLNFFLHWSFLFEIGIILVAWQRFLNTRKIVRSE
ncbi:metal-dependent hydrolase [Zooshikella harenae]|uniref:Metal-dependent hydrolase n=1 Tax=Zooshikella harenae TaxID=2827238 RepID=A0ABS5Z7U8_9GAMM|nr:metal-dependent hydrolase [Zooshikella harenae]MBU2710008.1 metal-dependent hydrolase [Zooshikella harenae]